MLGLSFKVSNNALFYSSTKKLAHEKKSNYIKHPILL